MNNIENIEIPDSRRVEIKAWIIYLLSFLATGIILYFSASHFFSEWPKTDNGLSYFFMISLPGIAAMAALFGLYSTILDEHRPISIVVSVETYEKLRKAWHRLLMTILWIVILAIFGFVLMVFSRVFS